MKKSINVRTCLAVPRTTYRSYVTASIHAWSRSHFANQLGSAVVNVIIICAEVVSLIPGPVRSDSPPLWRFFGAVLPRH